MTDTAPAGHHRGRIRVRTVLAVGILVPLAGYALVSASLLSERWHKREVSAEIEAGARVLRGHIGLRAALAAAQVQTATNALATELYVPTEAIPGFGADAAGAGPAGAHDELDRWLAEDPTPEAADLREELRAAVAERDAGTAGDAELASIHDRLGALLDERITDALVAVEATADRAELPSALRRDLRNLRASTAAFNESDQRVSSALVLLLDQGDEATAVRLLEANVRFEEAVSAVDAASGSPTARAWIRFSDDPAAQRTEQLLQDAAAIGLRGQGPVSLGLLERGAAIADGARWGLLLGDVVEAAAEDLAVTADADAAAETRAVVLQIAASTALTVVAVAVALFAARQIVRPAARLREAARQVGRGDLDLAPVGAQGPLELHATVEAFNDMAATLAAVEHHAVALAEDIDDPVLAEPLPGRTGRAMQVALDRLRESVEQAELHRAELTELATRDGLTGLLNRTAAMPAIERELARVRREGGAVVALYVDLDGLKRLNDRHGHAAGDEAIRQTAEALTDATRDADVVARLGGDEFLVVGPVTADGRAGVDAFAHRIHDAVRARAVDVDDGSSVALDCSVGVAVSGPGTDEADRLVRAADVALYDAKGDGRGRVAWYRPPERTPG